MEYGPSGMGGSEVEAYNGWLVYFCRGSKVAIKAQNLAKGDIKELSCLSSCPMKIVDTRRKIEDNSTLTAGILGHSVYTDSSNGVPSLQPAHGWALLLPVSSPLRSK